MPPIPILVVLIVEIIFAEALPFDNIVFAKLLAKDFRFVFIAKSTVVEVHVAIST